MRKWLWLILLALFILEGTILQWIIPSVWQSKIYVAPHFIVVIVIYIGLYVNRHTALVYGLIFGLLQDFIYYSPMLGPISFAMGLTGYLAGLMHRRLHSNIIVSMLVMALGNLFFDSIIYGLYRLFQINHLDLQWVFFHQMLPSMLINLLFALMVYVPVRKLFESMQAAKTDAEE
ncbi:MULTISPECIES: rod shape-determining protein MreD [Paenibacillus]|jgi:rod shape-determining protein MreD|uniref:Rod shape-determining protein MreD n=1 Tax=Paenibacillus baimaensis TaxID=2982185 RepID=A0ABT2UHQ5_9BACL|nr:MULTISPECIES: rod shape-determining protein MreD [unclassified Paenibacillus]MCU6793422.1 rod shape-determining protein MreD [Paenibacillus sp. WQ 127069]OMF15676.1 rod shape-determining protein MreD [Paenibacillus sp. FSL H7-0331]